MISIAVIDHVSPGLRAFARSVQNPVPGLKIAGRAVRNVLVKHYRTKDASEPNRLGGKRTHFWLEIARSVNQPVQSGPAAVTVEISDPRLMHKVKGGTITVKNKEWLTIPMRAEAHGVAASVLERALGIKLFRYGHTLAAKYKGQVLAFYALAKSAMQKADKSALPPEGVMERAAAEQMEIWLKKQKGAAGLT